MSRAISTDRKGNMAIMAMGTLAVVTLVAGGVVDYASLASQNQNLQSVADAAALGAAREMTISKNAREQVQAVASAIVESNVTTGNPKTKASIIDKGHAVEVFVTADPKVYFAGPVGANAGPVTARAVAEVSGSAVCMIGLDTKAKKTLSMRKKSMITATGCAIYSNSTAKDGISIEDNAEVNAGFICSAGGVKTSKKLMLDPAPITDCPPINDPLIGRPQPAIGACDFNKKKVAKGAVETLSPGVYCGGLDVQGNATLAGGVYIIKDGNLTVDDGGSLTGDDAGFFLTGKDALINFERASTIALKAPRSGPLAGLLFFEDRTVEAILDGGDDDDDDPAP